MITHIKIQNFRSFLEAEVDLRPFSLVVGANGSGKTNLLRFLNLVCDPGLKPHTDRIGDAWKKHVSSPGNASGFVLKEKNGRFVRGESYAADGYSHLELQGDYMAPSASCIFNLNADAVSLPETITPKASVHSSGSGTAQVLEALKSGEREDLFDTIEAAFKFYVPEVEKLSLRTEEMGKKQIQVREKGLSQPLPATELSEGTRIILAILTIIHQESPPSMILLEDIDRGLHPRLFEYMAPLLRDIAVRHGINIVATTHNPYLVDAMQDHKDAVIIVEKKDGASTLSTLASRLEGLDYDKVDSDDIPLEQLWFSGLIGGVPARLSSGVAK